MIKLNVQLTLPGGRLLFCGEIVCNEPDSRGRIAGAFRYAADFLEHPAAFALNPRTLALSSREFAADRPAGVDSVFEDSLPDDWGRRLLIRRSGLPRNRQTVPNLLAAMGGDGLGALSYFERQTEPKGLPGAPLTELETLLDVAWRYDAGNDVADEELRVLFQAASSPGGARPKALVRDHNGRHWIAKFPSSRDRLPLVPIEAATLAIAREAGLKVPDFKIQPAGKRQVLLVDRFDMNPAGGRNHMLSFQSLLGAEGYYNLGYPDLFRALVKYSSQPEIDIRALYRQMVFNAAIGNTDDHLKNFTLLHNGAGYGLSPAYDLLPDTNDRREHVLFFDTSYLAPDRACLLRIANRLGVRRANELVDQVYQAASGWRDIFKDYGVETNAVRQLEPGIVRRLAALAAVP